MKALSLTQPWATLVAIGAKRIETRSWNTNYRGRIAIHASKRFPRYARDICRDNPFHAILYAAGFASKSYSAELALGVVLATCRLVNVLPVASLPSLTEQEREFGDYTPGRFAWILENVEELSEPVPAKGALGLWEWKEELWPQKTTAASSSNP